MKSLSISAFLLAVWALAGAAVADTTPAQTGEDVPVELSSQEATASICPRPASHPDSSAQDQVAQACCKICRKGKACGNSCIARWKTCRKPPGCACDAN